MRDCLLNTGSVIPIGSQGLEEGHRKEAMAQKMARSKAPRTRDQGSQGQKLGRIAFLAPAALASACLHDPVGQPAWEL